MDKYEVKYRVLPFAHPVTKAKCLRPVIVDRQTYTLPQLVAFALNGGYVRGQHYDVCGTVNGILEAIQELGRQGHAVNLGDWLRVHGELTGKVDEVTRRVGPGNGYRTVLTPLKKMRGKLSDFTWVNADELEGRLRVSVISGDGCKEANRILPGRAISVTGAYLTVRPERGDSVVATWRDASGVERHAALVPTVNSTIYLKFAPFAALDGIPAGTEVTFTFRIHVGKAPDSPEQVARRAVIVVNAKG